MSMNEFQLRGYDTSKPYSETSVTSVSVFALVEQAVVVFKPIIAMFF